jgi:hypothetical protein
MIETRSVSAAFQESADLLSNTNLTGPEPLSSYRALQESWRRRTDQVKASASNLSNPTFCTVNFSLIVGSSVQGVQFEVICVLWKAIGD